MTVLTFLECYFCNSISSTSKMVIIKVMAGLERMDAADGVGIYPNLFLDAPSGVYVETMPIATHPLIHAILLQSQKSSTISASPVYLLQYVDRLLLSATSWAGIRLILIVSFSPNADTDFDLSSRTREPLRRCLRTRISISPTSRMLGEWATRRR